MYIYIYIYIYICVCVCVCVCVFVCVLGGKWFVNIHIYIEREVAKRKIAVSLKAHRDDQHWLLHYKALNINITK